VRQGIPPPGYRPGLIDFARSWKGWEFVLRESLGLLPMAGLVEDLRQQLRSGVKLDLGPVYAGGGASTVLLSTEITPPGRFVNAVFWQDRDGELARVEPSGGPLRAATTYQFGVQIGTLDKVILALDASAILEEVFRWSPEKKGVWVEIGVVAIDCAVTGDPVQSLWLPREGPSDTVYFAVSFNRPGRVNQLRYGVYYKNNLIQSFRMAAFVVPQAGGGAPSDVATRLGDALSVGVERIKGWYHARMEYSRTSALDELDRKGARALTIAANKLTGKDMITVKGTEVFETRIYPDSEMPDIVRQVRESLYTIAYGENGGKEEQYRFGPYAPNPDGMLSDALCTLAKAGDRLFKNIAPKPDTRNKLKSALTGKPKVIHIALLDPKKVVPWAFVYDRDYDPDAAAWNGKPAQQGVCLAALGTGTDLRTVECGALSECLLSDQVRTARETAGLPAYVERTVACPLRFWGYRHMIETPPQQVEDETSNEEASCIGAQSGFRLTAGLNAQLPTLPIHWPKLSGIGTWNSPLYDRDDILDRLRKQDLDFIYFFCHARGGEFDDKTIDPPFLEFQPVGAAKAQQIFPQNFATDDNDPMWAHRPLVFLNACGTLGYSPDALSPFLKALVDGRGASGVLGTEVPVPEVLAGEVACEFISRFVKGASAGAALLETRRDLLNKKNPLGLVYTLYAPASLAIDFDGDGKCG
jgi:hypothetical protein